MQLNAAVLCVLLCRYDGSAMFHTSECDVGYYYHGGNIMNGFYRVENTVI